MSKCVYRHYVDVFTAFVIPFTLSTLVIIAAVTMSTLFGSSAVEHKKSLDVILLTGIYFATALLAKVVLYRRTQKADGGRLGADDAEV